MRRILAIILTIASVVAIPAGCTQQKGLSDMTRISPKTHIASGRMLEAQRNFPGAEKQYRQAIDAQPNLTIAYHRLAELYLKLGRFDDARQTLRTAIESGADEASLRNNLGFTLLRLGQYDEAEQMFEAALAISPDFHRARMNLALLHARAGRIDESIEEFDKLLPHADSLYNVAVIRLQQRDYLTAAWGFGEAARINPNLPEARQMFEKARFLAQHSPQPEAKPDFLAALEIPPQPTEPQVVQTASVTEQPAQPQPRIKPRPQPTPKIANRNWATPKAVTTRKPASAQPTRTAITKAKSQPSPVAPTVTAAPKPVVSLMRDISTKVRKAAIAVAPTILKNEKGPSTTAASATTPKSIEIEARRTIAGDPCALESDVENVPTATSADPDCPATPMTAVQLTSAHPAKSANPEPMKPVTTE